MRYSAVELLAALILLFIVTPIVEDVPHGQFIEVLLLTIVLVSATFAIGVRGQSRWIGGVLVMVALGARWLQHFFPRFVPLWVFHAAALFFLVFVIFHLLRFVLGASRVNTDVLCTALAVYLLLGLLWALNYRFLAGLAPEAFAFSVGPEPARTMTAFNAFYFSFVVLSTVGFGDITPVSNAARMLAITEAVTGTFYMTVLIARLVSIYAPHREAASPPSSELP